MKNLSDGLISRLERISELKMPIETSQTEIKMKKSTTDYPRTV